MEIATQPPEFRFDAAAYPADQSAIARRNPFLGSADEMDDGNPFMLAATAATAPPSPNPFGLLPPDVSADGLSDGADPFDLFQHFASAPASPARAAAIYAQFSAADDQEDVGFQPRASYSARRTVASAVPFDWEEKPGTPKPSLGSGATPAGGDGENVNADFDFGVLLDRGAQEPDQLTTADELFDEGKIRPLKPPPRLLDGGSVGSSPRSARSVMWSPRLRGLSGSGPGPDFDPFAAAMAKASKAAAPSPLGPAIKDATAADAAADTAPMNPDRVSSPRSAPPPTTTNGGRKKWRLSDLLLFRRLSAKGRAGGSSTISREPVFKYSPVQHLGTPAKKTEPAAANGDASAAGGKQKKQGGKHGATTTGAEDGAARRGLSLIGCVRLNPGGLHRLAKGLNVSSTSHFRRRTATAAMHSA